ncbi:MAG: pitrilysin family protein [Acidobacteriota bacterium]
MIDPAPLNLHIERHQLANGLRVVLHQDRRLPLVAVNLWYHVGSKNELPGRTGFAHLFEHLLFQGSAHVGTNDHFKLVQQAGGVANGSTWYDRTNYYETLPSHQLDLGLWLESDRMGHFLPAITSEKLENQRQVVMNERRQRVDNQPYGSAIETLYHLLFPEGHPYRWPVIGYMEDIEAATLDMVQGFFETYYTPSNAVLTLAGDFEQDDALERVQRYFGDIPPGGPIERPRIEPVTLEGERRRVLEDQVNLPRLYMAFHAPPYGDDAWYAADLLARVLTSGRSSVLYDDLVVERRLAQDLGAYILPTESSSIFCLIASAKPGSDPDELDRALCSHLQSTADTLITDEALERARNSLLTESYHDLQSLADRADQISQFATYFDAPEKGMREIERYRALEAPDLRDFARRFLRLDRRALVTVLPASGGGAETAAT